jgi:hypothetical protein
MGDPYRMFLLKLVCACAIVDSDPALQSHGARSV